jgi:hypothetical protein
MELRARTDARLPRLPAQDKQNLSGCKRATTHCDPARGPINAAHRIGRDTGGDGLDPPPIVTATLLLLASLLSTGRAPAPPVATPIAVGHRYQLPATTAATRRAAALGTLSCRPAERTLRLAHVELFVRGRAVLLPAGIGIAPPAPISAGRVLGGRCRYPLSTADPTGVVGVNQPGRHTLGQLFRIWGQPLGVHRLLGFRSRAPLRAFVDGRAWHHGVRLIPLHGRAEIVVEMGRRIPPHSFYLFPEQA